MAAQTPNAGSRPATKPLPHGKGVQGKKHGGSTASWRSAY